MKLLITLSAIAFIAVRAEWYPVAPPVTYADNKIPRYAPEITVVEANKSYIVKLDCPGCPFAVRETNSKVSWQEPPQDNALRLQLTIETLRRSEPALLLNGRSILPLDPMPLDIKAFQVPANITEDDMMALWLGPTMWGVQLPLQYEHTVLRTQESGHLLVQIDVTGLPLDKINDPRLACGGTREPVMMDSEGQKLVQILLRQNNETKELLIEDVQAVLRKDRAQPLRMKCGNLAMVQTAYDPRQWDEYGKLGTWSRFQNLVGAFWSDNVENSPLLLSLALALALVIVMLRRWRIQGQQEKAAMVDDAEVALLGSEYEDAPPAYANIPVIKIEEYD